MTAVSTSLLYGSGSPEGVVTAEVDIPYLDTDTGAVWVKQTGSGNTGWSAGAAATFATEDYADAAAAAVVDSAPGTLDTLNELAAALGDDANFATTVTTALALKAPLASPAFTGTPTGITKTHVGLGNVDNTADSAKPVSTAQQTALDLKAPLASPTFTGTVSGVTKAHVGLGNVDNTSDANKPVSTAQQTALDLKAPIASPTFTGTVTIPTGASITAPTGLVKGDVGLGNVDNTADASKTFAGEAITSGTVAIARLPLDADLATLALPASTTISAFGATLVDDADNTAARTTLGLGTMATQAEASYALLAGRAGGQTLIGGTAANEDLILKATSHATDATSFIDCEHNIRVRPTAFTTTDNTGGGIRLFQAGVGVITLNAASDNCLYGGIVGGGTVVFNADGLAAAAVRGFFVTESVVRNATEVTVNLTGAVRGHFLSPVIQVDATPTTGTATLTAPNFTIFRAEGSMSRRNSGVGTLNCTDFIGVHITTGVVGTGCTVTTRTALLISNPSAPTGTITTFIGLDIVNQTRATTNIGLRNAATTVFTSTSYTVGAGGGSVPVTSTFVKLTGVNTGTMVLGTPSITTTGAQNGQVVIVQNIDAADSVTFVDGTNLDLPGSANLTLGPTDTAGFVFDGTNWVCIFTSNN